MKRPIGIFDSGVGGTSIFREIHQLMPFENTLYLADSKNAPYGTKSKNEILQLSIKNTEFLLQKGCKLIVVACNTATTNAIDYLRANYDVPFVGIEPAIKPAALCTKTKKVGVLATKGTLTSQLFYDTAKIHGSGIEIIEQEGKGLVELVEMGRHDSEEAKRLLKEFLAPMLNNNIDCLVLGCTHYPYLAPVLKELLPQNVQIIDSGHAVAKQTQHILSKHMLLNMLDSDPTHTFYTNTDVEVLRLLLNNHGYLILNRDF